MSMLDARAEGASMAAESPSTQSPGRQRSDSLFAVSGNADFDAIIPGTTSSSPKREAVSPLQLEGYPLMPSLGHRRDLFNRPSPAGKDRTRSSSDPLRTPPVTFTASATGMGDYMPTPQPLSPPPPRPVPLSHSATTMAAANRILKPIRGSRLMRRSSTSTEEPNTSVASGGEELGPTSTNAPRSRTPTGFLISSPFRSATPSATSSLPATASSGSSGALRRSTSLSSFLFPPPATNNNSATTAPSATSSRKVSSDISFSAIVQRLRSVSGGEPPAAHHRRTPSSPNQTLTPPLLLLGDADLFRTRGESVFEDPTRALPSHSVTSSIFSEEALGDYALRKDTLDQLSEEYEEYEEEEEEELEEEEGEEGASLANAVLTTAEDAALDVPDYCNVDELLERMYAVRDRAKRLLLLDALLGSALDFNKEKGPGWFTNALVRFVNKYRCIDVLERWLIKFQALHTCIPFLSTDASGADAHLMIVLASFPENRIAASLTQQILASQRALKERRIAPAAVLLRPRAHSMDNTTPYLDEHLERAPERCRSCDAIVSHTSSDATSMPSTTTTREDLALLFADAQAVANRPLQASSRTSSQTQLLPRPAANSFTSSNSAGGHSRQSSLTFSKRNASFTSLASLFSPSEDTPLKRLDPRVVAEQLMHIMCTQACCHLTPASLRTVQARKVDVYVQRLVRLFELLSYWPVTEILSDAKRTASERIDDFGFFCQLAKESRRVGNFHAVFALVGSLQSPMLKWVEDLATRRDAAAFRSLQRLCRPDNNYKVYFADLSKRDRYSPCIPYLGLLNRTLLGLQCEVPVFAGEEDERKINFARCRKVWKEITAYLQFQPSSSYADMVFVEEGVRRMLVDSMCRSVMDYGELAVMNSLAKASYKKSARQRAFHRARTMGHQIVGSPDDA